MDDDTPSLDLGAPAKGSREAYRVLARKYRPQTFDSLIGQEAMVKTLSNAFALGRIAHAFMLTGVRGVGKTTTARIIARALNCVGKDGKNTRPTIAPCGVCEPCVSIAESRHVDVQEMDAASRTGIDDIREIVEGVRYTPVSARYKVYIIDEVHMLSKAAFNGLLKTLEEPPPHVKFIFATTEIRKVPVTVLSRCQRFDLRRIGADELISFLEGICKAEKVKADRPALALIARAAEGSARDALSLLDQAIAHAAEEGGKIIEDSVRGMLGLADRTRTIDLYEAIMKGDAKTALDELRTQYDSGAEPLVVIQDLLELTHWLTRVKIAPDTAADPSLAESDSKRGADMAAALPISALTRSWQILLKGVVEVRDSPQPVQAAEMLLIRLAYAAELPSPDKLIRQLTEQGQGAITVSPPASRGPAPAPAPSSPSRGGARPAPRQAIEPEASAGTQTRPIASFDEIMKLVAEHRETLLRINIERHVHLVRCERGRIELRLENAAPRGLSSELADKLSRWTGERWVVTLVNAEGEPTLEQQAQARKNAQHAAVMKEPLVQAALKTFAGAKIVAVRDPREEAALDPVEVEDKEEAEE
jgi:DNA polymerase III subunit gamma/tau